MAKNNEVVVSGAHLFNKLTNYYGLKIIGFVQLSPSKY